MRTIHTSNAHLEKGVRKLWITLLPVLLLCLHSASHAQAPQPAKDCKNYDFDVSAELRLMGTDATRVTAAASSQDVPSLETGRPYQLHLNAKADVKFGTAPGRLALDGGAFAGMARFSVPTAGTWRIGIDHNSWIDVIDPDGAAVAAGKFNRRQGCATLRKIVEFPLQPGLSYILQLSGGNEATIKVLISGPVSNSP